jgi:hypothetical protein
MTLATWVYRIAGVSGIVLLLPQFFLEERIGRDHPPAITHPEFFYGMLGTALAWQLGFLVIASHPSRYRPLMIPTWFEKFIFGTASILLFVHGRVPPVILGFGIHDLVFGVLFVLSYLKTPSSEPKPAAPLRA